MGCKLKNVSEVLMDILSCKSVYPRKIFLITIYCKSCDGGHLCSREGGECIFTFSSHEQSASYRMGEKSEENLHSLIMTGIFFHS